MSLPDNVTNETNFREGAMLLMQVNRSRYMYNFLVQGWKSNTQKTKLVYELNKHLRIMLSNITLRQIEEMKPVAEAIGKDVEAKTEIVRTPVAENKEKVEIKVRTKGMREDHNNLPPHIQALFTETLNLLRKERSLHEKLKTMENAKPCDRHEYVNLLIKLDKQRRADWEKYDQYRYEDTQAEKVGQDEQKQSYSANDATNIGNCRTFISRNIGKAIKLKDDKLQISKYISLVAELKSKYEMATALGASCRRTRIG